ncbi:MAG: hypothetical protein ACQEVA_21245 [Myxococcota bacterium]
MTVMTRAGLVAALCSFLVVSCLPTGSTNGGEGDAQSAPQDDTGSSTGEDGGSTEDTGQLTEDTSEPQDTGQSTEDTSEPQDTGETTEDTSDPRDTGNPFENACEDGPLDAPIEGCSPTPLPTTGDPREDCVRRINQFRWECQCLPPLERWHDGEQCADEQATYDAENNSPHAGFRENICSPRGSAQNECPGYGTWDSVIGTCLQQMWDEGPGEPFSEHGHYINMSSTQYTKVACGSGDGWFVQNFR